MHRRVVRFLLLIVVLATVASACTAGGATGLLTPTSGGGSYRPPPAPLPGDFQRLGTIQVGPYFSQGQEQIKVSRTGRYVYWVDNADAGPTKLWFADVTTGQSQVVYDTGPSIGIGIQLRISSPAIGDEGKVYFQGWGTCSTGCTWSPTQGLAVAPGQPDPKCLPVRWPDETTLILECWEGFQATGRQRYDLVTGEITDAGPDQVPVIDGLHLYVTSPNGRYQLFTGDVMAPPAAKVKDLTTGTVTDVGVTGSNQTLMLLSNWWFLGPLSFITWHGVTDDGVVIYDKAVFHQTLRSEQIRFRDPVTGTDSILPGYDALRLVKWGSGSWMIDLDYWNEIGRNAIAEGRQDYGYLELSKKDDPSQRYGLPAGTHVASVMPDGNVLVTSMTPLNAGDPPGLGIYYHDGPS